MSLEYVENAGVERELPEHTDPRNYNLTQLLPVGELVFVVTVCTGRLKLVSLLAWVTNQLDATFV